jgi:hypothetical protein
VTPENDGGVGDPDRDSDDHGGVRAGGESVRGHLAQPDHWTFLLALVLVAGNVAANSRLVSLAAAVLLSVALAYDAYEFHGDRSSGRGW